MTNLPSFRPAALPPVPNLSKQGLLLPTPGKKQAVPSDKPKSTPRPQPTTTDSELERLWVSYHQEKFLTPPALDPSRRRRGVVFTTMSEFLVVPLVGDDLAAFLDYCDSNSTHYGFADEGQFHLTETQRRTHSVIAAHPKQPKPHQRP